MTRIRIFAATLALISAAGVTLYLTPACAGPVSSTGYQALAPIRHGNLTIFPVVSGISHDTGQFLTLDEGLRSGEVVVTEAGRDGGMIRPPQAYPVRRHGGDEVNRLVLENNSRRPLLLLAGEIVTGGKQDRIVGKDLIIPAEDESDLSVFCVEPGRWTERTAKFNAGGAMAQPSIRVQAMGNHDQQAVWSEVDNSKAAIAGGLPAPAASALSRTSSYATAIENAEVVQQVDSISEPIQHSYERVMRELRSRNAVGVVVAVNSRIVWADVFASNSLLEKYWPKLVRSYAAQALATVPVKDDVSTADAQAFLDRLDGRHETTDTDPGVYRYSETSGEGYKVFELTSLLPKTGFEVHWSKMAD